MQQTFHKFISFLLTVRQFVRFTFLVVYTGIIALLSLLPPKDLPNVPLFPGADKLIHFMMYFILSLLFNWVFKLEKNFLRVLFIVPATIGWGILMEYLQLEMHAGRDFSWYDALANSMGVVIGVVIYLLATKKSVF